MKNEEDGQLDYIEVKSIYISETIIFVNIKVKGELIEITLTHPFMTESGEWKSAYQLEVVEKLITSNGEL